jgi:phage repressor protein C with HTH and peptisase S24 domain
VIPFKEGAHEKPKNAVPYYNIKVAAGFFGLGSFNKEVPSGWVQIKNHKNLEGCFATHISGRSMEPSIPSGSLCLFRLYQGGTRQNRIFLIKASGLLDTETDQAFVVKKYKRLGVVAETQNRSQVVVHLLSENKSFPPIVLMASNEKKIEVVAEFLEVIE